MNHSHPLQDILKTNGGAPHGPEGLIDCLDREAGERQSDVHAHYQTKFRYHEHYERDAQVFDYYQAPADPATVHENRRLHEAILRELPDSARVVLDVGCGNAWLAEALIPREKTVISLDIATENLKKAKRKVDHPNHFTVRADVLDLPFEPGSIDAIVSAEVMEHVADVELYVANILRVLKPGGTAVISTPYNENIQHSLCVHCNRSTPHHAHLHAFDEHSLDGIRRAHPTMKVRAVTLSSKVLLHARTHVVLRRLPYAGWRVVDRLVNGLWFKPSRLIFVVEKRGDN